MRPNAFQECIEQRIQVRDARKTTNLALLATRSQLPNSRFSFSVIGEVTIAHHPKLTASLQHITRFGKHPPGRRIADRVVFMERRIVEDPVDSALRRRNSTGEVEHSVPDQELSCSFRSEVCPKCSLGGSHSPVRLIDEGDLRFWVANRDLHAEDSVSATQINDL